MIPGIEEKRLVNGVIQNGWPSYATLHQASVSLQDMGDRVITTQVRIDGDVVPDFSGWELYFMGERFVLPSDNPQASKDNSTRNSIVDLQFQSWVIQELKRYYFFEAASVAAGVAIADKYVTPVRLDVEDFVAMLNQVLKYYFGDKVVADLYMSGQGQYSQEPKVIDINYSYLWDVVGQVYEIYGVRNRIVYNSTTGVYTIKFGWPTTDIDIDDHDFEYGYKGGLLKFERQVQDESITNILLGRGGEKNLPYRYFKKVDPENPNWAADPDAIPELASIYFDRLRDINFRWYVRGWMHNPNRDTSGDEAWDPGHVFPTYEISSDSPYYWAYQKGLTDTQFNPVEFVKDDASIEAYGERWGAADDNDEIYPTIQGRSRSPIGRIDEVVAVSEIVTDDINATASESALEKSINPLLVNYPRSNDTLPIESATFEVPTGQTGNISYAWVGPTDGTGVHINTAQSTLVAVDTIGTEHSISGLSAGTYFLRLRLTLYVPSGQQAYGTFGMENIKLTTSAQDANAWKPTFDIWVKNIWGTTKGSSESADQYATRVWQDILGDRAGNEAKVVFSTGFMSVSEDYEFVIASYPVYDTSKTINGVPSEWRITLRKSDAEYDATGLFIPNASTGGKPIAGDKFFFTGIDMPFLYVTLGEEDLNTNKSSQLEGLSVVNPTWVISLDKVRVHTLEDGEYGQTLADRLAAGAKLRITDPRFSGGDILTLYAQSITYTWNEPSENSPYIVPDIEVVLSDKVVSRQSRADKMESSIQEIRSNYARLDDVERVVRSVAEPMFLKKTGEADSSDSPTQFASKVSSKGFRQGGVGGNGWGFYRDNTKEVAEGEEGEGDSVLEVDRVVVRKELQVNSLVVNQTEYRGGREIQSAAHIECTKVVVDDSGKYVCYFDQKQGSVKNLFVVGDFAYSTEFAPDNTVVKYYRRRVDAVDVDRIVLSDTVKDGAGVPTEGDLIIQYGHESNTARQYVIIRDVIGGGYERMLSGLNSVSANGDEYFFAGKQDGQNPRVFVGDAAGEHAEWKNGQLNIKGRLTVMNSQGAYVSMQDYMNAVSLQFDEQQREIDKQTQSWASGEAPTAQTKPYPLWDEETQQIIGTPNFPYTQWLDDTERAKHVGDSYVDDSAGQSYRLTKKTVSGTTVYYWTRITDEEISQAISTSQQAYAAAEALQYLKSATNEGTLVDGGLVLTSMIQLGYTPQGGAYTVMSGINGKPNTQLQDPTRSIAAWYGGPMIDHETYPSVQSYAKSLFRMDGSGYMAGGKISWQPDGDGRIPGINWETVGGVTNVTIGANVKLESLQGSDSSVTDLIELVRSVSGMFVDESYTEGGQTKHRIKVNPNFTGLYTDGFLSGGGLSQSSPGGGGGGLDPALMWKYLTNDPTLPSNPYANTKIADAHLPDLNPGTGVSASYSGNLYLNLSLDYSAVAGQLGLSGMAYKPANQQTIIDALGYTPVNPSSLGSFAYINSLSVSDIPNLSGTYLTTADNYVVRGRGNADADTASVGAAVAEIKNWVNTASGYGGYIGPYGTSLNIVNSHYTWINRLDFATYGEIDFWQGINTTTMSRIGKLWHSGNSGTTSTDWFARILYLSSNIYLNYGGAGPYITQYGIFVHDSSNSYVRDLLTWNCSTGVVTATYDIHSPQFHTGAYSGMFRGDNITASLGANDVCLYAYNGSNEATIYAICNTFYTDNHLGVGRVATTHAIEANGSIYATNQLISAVSTGTAPLSVASTTRVANLNAEYISGYDSDHLMKHLGSVNPNAAVGNCIIYALGPNYPDTLPFTYGTVAQFTDNITGGPLTGGWTFQLAWGTWGNDLWIRGCTNGSTDRGGSGWSGWSKFWNTSNSGTSSTDWTCRDISVNGNANVVGVIHASTGIWTEGYLSGGGLSQSSDQRLKRFIEDFSYTPGLLMALRPREWEWNGKAAMEGHAAGFVAQEVEGLLPYMVDDTREYLALYYDQFHALEVAALQDHETRLVAIEKENEAIRKENVALRMENRQLRERLNMN